MFTYKLSAIEYQRACRYRRKNSKLQSNPGTISFVMAIIMLFGFIMLRANIFFFLLPLVAMLFGVYEISSLSQSYIKEYERLPYLRSVHKCSYNESGVEIQNSFEMVFSSYKDIFFIKNTKKYLLVLLNIRKGIIYIDKKTDADNANALIEALKKGGAKI